MNQSKKQIEIGKKIKDNKWSKESEKEKNRE